MTFEENIQKIAEDLVNFAKPNTKVEFYFGRGSPPNSQEEVEKLPVVFLDILFTLLKTKKYSLSFYSFELETGKFVFEYTLQDI